MQASSINSNEYSPYYQPYIKSLKDTELISGLKESDVFCMSFFKSLPQEKLQYRYADNKWTIKEIITHLIDTERIFSYRALRFARQDKTPLMGFDQDNFVIASNANIRDINSILNEYQSVRNATIQLFKSFSHDALKQIGKASGNNMSVRAAGFTIIGHEKHHINIIQERYL